MKRIYEIDQFFKKENKQFIFKGKELKVYVPKFYKNYGYFIQTNVLKVLGILKLEIDNKFEAIFCLTDLIETLPNEIDDSSDENYYILKYKTNDIFINKTFIIVNSESLYLLFMRFLTYGKIPDFLDYKDLYKLFRNTKEINGTTLGVGKEIEELLFAYQCRDINDWSKQYRLTKMKDKYKLIGVLNIIYAPQSTTAKLLGNYLDDGITGAVLTDNPKTDDVEQALIR